MARRAERVGGQLHSSCIRRAEAAFRRPAVGPAVVPGGAQPVGRHPDGRGPRIRARAAHLHVHQLRRGVRHSRPAKAVHVQPGHGRDQPPPHGHHRHAGTHPRERDALPGGPQPHAGTHRRPRQEEVRIAPSAIWKHGHLGEI